MKPISNPSWKSSLRKKLNQFLHEAETPGRGSLRVGILGIGSELRGDDAAGVLLVRALQPVAEGHASILVLDGGAAPENFTGPLRRFGPDRVLLVDAALMGEEPGTAHLLDWRETTGLSATTHTLPPYVLANYLANELDCSVALLGIQPVQNEFDQPLSPEVEAAVRQVTEMLMDLLELS